MYRNYQQYNIMPDIQEIMILSAKIKGWLGITALTAIKNI